MIKKGTLLRDKQGRMATVIAEPFTKLFRDAHDWECARYGIDSATAATAIRVVWYADGRENVYKYSDARRLFTVVEDKDSTPVKEA